MCIFVASNTETKRMGFFNKSPKPTFCGKYQPDAWRKDIPQNDVFDSHIWDRGAKDADGDGYRDGSVGDGGLWDDW